MTPSTPRSPNLRHRSLGNCSRRTRQRSGVGVLVCACVAGSRTWFTRSMSAARGAIWSAANFCTSLRSYSYTHTHARDPAVVVSGCWGARAARRRRQRRTARWVSVRPEIRSDDNVDDARRAWLERATPRAPADTNRTDDRTRSIVQGTALCVGVACGRVSGTCERERGSERMAPRCRRRQRHSRALSPSPAKHHHKPRRSRGALSLNTTCLSPRLSLARRTP